MEDDRVIPPVYYIENGQVVPASGADISGGIPAAGTPIDPSAATGIPTGATQTVNDFGGALPTDTIGNYTLMELVQMLIVYAFIIAAALAAFFIFYGGISFILSGGNDEKIKTAVNTIRYAIVGLIITILSFTFVTIVGRIFGLDFLSYISYDQIRASITRLLTPVSSQEPPTFNNL